MDGARRWGRVPGDSGRGSEGATTMFRNGDFFENEEKLLLNLCISEGVFSFFLDNFRIVDFIRGLTFICNYCCFDRF